MVQEKASASAGPSSGEAIFSALSFAADMGIVRQEKKRAGTGKIASRFVNLPTGAFAAGGHDGA